MLQLTVTATNVIFFCKFFPFTKRHIIIVFVLILFIAFCILCAVIGLDKILEPGSFVFKKYFLQFSFALLVYGLNIYFLNKENMEFIDEVYEKLKSKEEFKFILDKLDYSIIIIDGNKTDFVNTKFLHTFKSQIIDYQLKLYLSEGVYD